MAANVVNSPTAVQASIQVVKAFIRIRQMIIEHEDLNRRLARLEKQYEGHDAELKAVFDALRRLMAPVDNRPRKKIGFRG